MRVPSDRVMAVVWVSIILTAGPATLLAAQSGWREQRVIGPFVCRADFPLGEVDTLVAHLRQLQQDLVNDLGIPAAKQWIELYLFHDQATYERYLARHFPSAPYRRALYLKTGGQGRVFSWRGPQWEVDVRHECTHALLHAALPAVPLWLDEGLAEHYENAPERRFGGAPQFSEAVWAARLGRLGDLGPLEAMQRIDEMGQAQYRDAWAWVTFLLYASPYTRRQLAAYLADLAQPSPAGSLKDRLDARVPGYRDQFFRFWRAPPNSFQAPLGQRAEPAAPLYPPRAGIRYNR